MDVYVCLIEIGWSLGVFTMGCICVLTPLIDILGEDWRMLYLVLAALSSVPLIMCSWVLPEVSYSLLNRPKSNRSQPSLPDLTSVFKHDSFINR